MGKFIDLTGQKFGRLTVIKYVGKSKWLCKCECGNEKIVSTTHLKNDTKSCGCLRAENTKKRNTKHGFRYSRLYIIWKDIKRRCYNKNSKSYYLYGERGIIVCQEWLDDFMNFYDWAMPNGYKDNLTIDRIDVNGNYEPSNCRWVDRKIQANNKRNNCNITYNNETHTLSEWAEILNINYDKLRYRIYRNWNIEKI